jgi:hypothetical protein
MASQLGRFKEHSEDLLLVPKEIVYNGLRIQLHKKKISDFMSQPKRYRKDLEA